jgi:hypothetical protein
MPKFSTTIVAFWSLEETGSWKVHLWMLLGPKGFFCGRVTWVVCKRGYLVPHSEAEKTRLREMTEADL